MTFYRKRTDIFNIRRPATKDALLWQTTRQCCPVSEKEVTSTWEKHFFLKVFLPRLLPFRNVCIVWYATVCSGFTLTRGGTMSLIMRRIIPNAGKRQDACFPWKIIIESVLCAPVCPNYLSFIACHSKWACAGKEKKKSSFARCLCYYSHWDTLEIQSIFVIGENWHCTVKRGSICMKFQAHL